VLFLFNNDVVLLDTDHRSSGSLNSSDLFSTNWNMNIFLDGLDSFGAFVYNLGLLHFLVDDCLCLILMHLSTLDLLVDLLLMLLMDNGNMLLMNDLLMFLMNNWHVFFVDVILVNHWLMMLMNHILMMLMKHILMLLLDHLLMVLMHNLFVMFFDNRCFVMLSDYCIFSMLLMIVSATVFWMIGFSV